MFDTISIIRRCSYLYHKRLQRQSLIGSAVAGFNNTRTITKASATDLDTRQDDHTNGKCSTASLGNKPVRLESLDASFYLK